MLVFGILQTKHLNSIVDLTRKTLSNFKLYSANICFIPNIYTFGNRLTFLGPYEQINVPSP